MMFSKNKAIISWCLYDWANSVLATIIFTFIFAIYFARSVVGDEVLGSAYWGYAVGFSGFIIAITSPLLGAITDTYGPRKLILGTLTAITIIATAALFWILPHIDFIPYALVLVIITTIGFELAQAQYNAMLSDVAPPHIIGKISGIAWSLGYFGGLACLVIALIGFIGLGTNETGLLNLSINQDFNIRATSLLAAIWYGVFAIPLFLWVPDREKKLNTRPVLKTAMANLSMTVQSLTTSSQNILRFLISSAIYRDGLNTLFAVGGLYAAGTFDLTFQEILLFAIGLNITCALGALALGFLDDIYGSKNIIMTSLIALIILGTFLIIVTTKISFIILALTLGFFLGPIQSSSRTLMAKLAPAEKTTELFGLYAMSGKSIAFTGPLLFGFLTQITGNQRWGIAAIIVLWLIGLILIKKVKV